MSGPLNEMEDALKDIEFARHQIIQTANALAPLKDYEPFKAFLKTIEADLEGTVSDSESVPATVNDSPRAFALIALQKYQRDILSRVEEYMKQAQVVQQEIQQEGESEHGES